MIFMSTKLMDVLKQFQSIIVTNKQIETYETWKNYYKKIPGQFERVSRNCSCAGVFKSLNPIFAGRKNGFGVWNIGFSWSKVKLDTMFSNSQTHTCDNVEFGE